MLTLLVHIAGAVALLLWSVRLIRTGVERAFSGPLRIGLRQAARSPVTAIGGGAVAAIAMQSSTAVAMLVAGFATSGTLASSVGLAIVFGADLGSAVAARILLLPIDAVVSFLLVLGVVLFLRASSRRLKQFGRVVIGLALVLVSLSMLRIATQPLQANPMFEVMAAHLSGDFLTAFVIGAFLAWAMHSSVAAVLMVVTFAAQNLLDGPSSIALVLGANLGGGFIPVWLTMKSAPGPVTLSCRSDCSLMQPLLRRPRGFSSRVLNASVADCRSH